MTTVTDSSIAHTFVTGGAGVRLHVVETGNPAGRPIVFLHGFSQSWLAWRRQLESELADDYRLVAMDLRGHGQSDRPHDAYADPSLWADDVAAVIGELRLQQPVLCGWSYGPLVIFDYVRKYGENAIGGICLVDALTKLGSEAALAALTPELLQLVPGFFSHDADEATHSLGSLLRMCFAEPPAEPDLYQMLGYNLSVPPAVRQALFSRSLDNDDLLPQLRTPVLVIHGAQDAIVKPTVVDQLQAAVPHAQARVLPAAGHAPFWDDAPAFNRELRAFCAACQQRLDQLPRVSA